MLTSKMNELNLFHQRPPEAPPDMENVMTRNFRLSTTSLALLLAASPSLAQELNALVWCDHTDPALIQPF